MSLIAERIARLRASTADDGWEGGNPAPPFARDLLDEILALRDGARSIGFLVAAVARTVVPIWRPYEDLDPIVAAIDAIEEWLNRGASREACRQFVSPVRTAYVDCTACQLECAAETVAAAARYVANDDFEAALSAISWAWEAINQSGGGSNEFLIWLADEALPASLECRAPAPFVRAQ
jgi:hypothetical protein